MSDKWPHPWHEDQPEFPEQDQPSQQQFSSSSSTMGMGWTMTAPPSPSNIENVSNNNSTSAISRNTTTIGTRGGHPRSMRKHKQHDQQQHDQQQHRHSFQRGAGHNHHHHNHRHHRLWDLPEKSIVEYARWVQEKPEEEQTPAERRFLWKYMIRCLDVRKQRPQHHGGKKEKTRQFVERLEVKPDRTALEEEFIRHFHCRQHQKKLSIGDKRQKKNSSALTTTIASANDSTNAVIVWERNQCSNRQGRASTRMNGGTNSDDDLTWTTTNGDAGVMISLASLRESMNKLGLSSDKLLKQEQQQDQQPVDGCDDDDDDDDGDDDIVESMDI